MLLDLWLVRHGESEGNVRGEFSGWSDVPLTEQGRAQATALRGELTAERFSSVWSSDLRRAQETARLAWGEPRLDRRLREMHFGTLEGTAWEGSPYARRLVEFKEFAAPEGEDLEGFHARVVDFVRSLPEGKHLIFAHGGVLRTLAVSLGVDRFVGNGGLLVIDWTAQRIVRVHEPWALLGYR